MHGVALCPVAPDALRIPNHVATGIGLDHIPVPVRIDSASAFRPVLGAIVEAGVAHHRVRWRVGGGARDFIARRGAPAGVTVPCTSWPGGEPPQPLTAAAGPGLTATVIGGGAVAVAESIAVPLCW